MRVSTAVAALAGQVFATQEEHCGTAAVHDHTALLQNLLIQTHVAVQAGDEQHKTSADHVFDQAAAVLQNVQNTPGIATFADDIRSQITADDGFLAAIQAAHNADQLELDGLWAEVVSSMNAATDKITEIESMQLDVGIVATSHVTCREDESPLCMEAEACHVRLEAAEAELTTAEAVVSSTQTAIKTSWCGNDMSMQLDFRDAARPILSTYLGEEIIADTKREARDAIQLECDGKEVLRLAKRGECNSVQVNFEAQSCQLATFFSHSLDLAEQQVHAATTAYQTARTDVEAQEEIRKKEFLTLTRTECLLDRIHEVGELPCDENQMTQNDVAAQANACHNIEVDTSSLNIMYHDAEDVPAFPPVPSVPCSGDFMSSHYDLMDSLSSCGGPQDCAPCETAPPPPPPPPPPQPAERVLHFVYSSDGVGNADSLCLSVATSNGGTAGCTTTGGVLGCAVNRASDTTLQVCNENDDNQRFGLYRSGVHHTLRSLLGENQCLTVDQSTFEHQIGPLTLAPCVDSERQQFAEENVQGFAGVKFWRNVGTKLAIWVHGGSHRVDNYVMACPGSNAAMYWRPTIPH